MARKITMFELHFDGAHFGPTLGDEPEEESEWSDVEEYGDEYGEGPVGGSLIRPALAAVGAIAAVSTVGYLASRRFRGGDEEDEFEESDYVDVEDREHTDEPLAE